MAAALLNLIASSSIAVNWYRHLLQDDDPRLLGGLRLDGTVFRFAAHALLLNIMLFLLVVMPFNLLPDALAIVLTSDLARGALAAIRSTGLTATWLAAAMSAIMLVFIASLLVPLLRLSLAFPAIALERRDYGFAAAWRDSAGHSLRLYGLVLLLLIVCVAWSLLLRWVPGWVLGTPIGDMARALDVLLTLVANWVIVLLAITTAGVLYAIFVEQREI
jgi:hypothetical protein